VIILLFFKVEARGYQLNAQVTKKAIFKSNQVNEFARSKCILTISVGQPNHEGDKLFSTLLAVNKHFSLCLIMVCDSLQRHTRKISSRNTLEVLHNEANNLGDQWITRNSRFIRQLAIPYKISRWDDWMSSPNYPNKRLIINSLYTNAPLFKKSIDETAYAFSERKMDIALVDRHTAFILSQEYLLEECAVMLLQADDGYPFEIYPSQRNDAMDYVYQQIISYTNRDLMRAVSIKFKNLSPDFSQERTLA
jgi:hypothetical protein